MNLPEYEATRGDQWAGPAVTLTLTQGNSPVDFTGAVVECTLRDHWGATSPRYTFSGGALVVTVTPSQGKIVVQPILTKEASAALPLGVYACAVSVEKTPALARLTLSKFTLKLNP